MEFAIGEEVEITIKGTVQSGVNYDHACGHTVKDAGGRNHYVYLHNGDNSGLKIKRLEVFKAGAAYEDADGDVFLRNADNDAFLDTDGDEATPKRPIKPLVSAPTASKADIVSEIQRYIRANSFSGSVSSSSASSLVDSLVRSGKLRVKA